MSLSLSCQLSIGDFQRGYITLAPTPSTAVTLLQKRYTEDIEKTWTKEIENQIRQIILEVMVGRFLKESKNLKQEQKELLEQLRTGVVLTEELAQKIRHYMDNNQVKQMLKNEAYRVIFNQILARYDPIGIKDIAPLGHVDPLPHIINGLDHFYHPDQLDIVLSMMGMGILADHKYKLSVVVKQSQDLSDLHEFSWQSKDLLGKTYHYYADRQKRTQDEMNKRRSLLQSQLQDLQRLISFYNELSLSTDGFPRLSMPFVLPRIQTFGGYYLDEEVFMETFTTIEDLPEEIATPVRAFLLAVFGFHLKARTRRLGDEFFDMRMIARSVAAYFDRWEGVSVREMPEKQKMGLIQFLIGAVTTLNYVVTDKYPFHNEVFYEVRRVIYNHMEMVWGIIQEIQQNGHRYRNTSLLAPVLLFVEIGAQKLSELSLAHSKQVAIDDLLLGMDSELADLRLDFIRAMDVVFTSDFYIGYFKDVGMIRVDHLDIPTRHDYFLNLLVRDLHRFVEIEKGIESRETRFQLEAL